MNHERLFYRCNHCGNIISYILASGVPVMCCGERMQALTPNTTDAAQEKHVPIATREGSRLTVKVGSVPHPMLPEHHIAWIAVAEADRTTRVLLQPGARAEAVLCVDENPVTVYEYCNLHGLWVAEL
ncbi:MAG: desulfoferrodoxin [Clostridiales bacterium]|nr:desulfoferrodoxin [Clostridiales bacterium]